MSHFTSFCQTNDGPRSLTTWHLVFVLIMMTSGYLSIAVSQIALGIGLLGSILGWALCRRAPVHTGLERPVLALAVWALVMIPFSTDPGWSLAYYKRFYLFTAIWVVATSAGTERRRLLLAVFLFLGAAVVSIVGIIHALRTTGGLFDFRMGQISNPMTSGAMLMMAVMLVFGFLFTPGLGRRLKLAVGAVGLLLFLAFAMTMTRSAILGFVAGLGLMLLMRKPRMFGVFFVAVLLFGTVVLTTGEHWLSERAWSRVNPEFILEGKNTRERIEMWQGGLEMVKAHPITGVGDIGLEEISKDYYVSSVDFYYGHMHNNFVHLAVIWGLPGLLLGTWFLVAPAWLLVRRWFRLKNESDPRRAPPVLKGWVLGVAGAWAGFFVAGFTEWYLGDAETMLIYLAILGVALGPRLSETEQAES